MKKKPQIIINGYKLTDLQADAFQFAVSFLGQLAQKVCAGNKYDPAEKETAHMVLEHSCSIKQYSQQKPAGEITETPATPGTGVCDTPVISINGQKLTPDQAKTAQEAVSEVVKSRLNYLTGEMNAVSDIMLYPGLNTAEREEAKAQKQRQEIRAMNDRRRPLYEARQAAAAKAPDCSLR